MQKEFGNLLSAISKWEKAEKGNVCFVGSFLSFDKKCEIKDDRIVGFGTKEIIKISLESLEEELKKDKKKFINW